ncbi:MAG: hypothetical protein JSC189_000049 [Candidatus Tokpelaia sp. JSC189]|nr:MAG: hypothetical protein JSC189_000049 [Candidatus Tokpelaia sp. JSC189]
MKEVMTETSPAPYIGGKRTLSKILIERINQTNHKGYAEPLAGMGSIFRSGYRKSTVAEYDRALGKKVFRPLLSLLIGIFNRLNSQPVV